MKVKWRDREVVAAIQLALKRGEKRSAILISTRAKASTLFVDRTNALRNSIRYTHKPPSDARVKKGWFVMAGGKGVWGDAWYAPKVELGWKNASARPFMKAARNANIGRMKLIFKSIFGRGARLRRG